MQEQLLTNFEEQTEENNIKIASDVEEWAQKEQEYQSYIE